MFRLVKYKNINKEKWDECISNSSENIIYALSWYLNIVSPHWEAFILEEKGSYKAVFPLTVVRRLGLPFLIQPFFVQQLGLFSSIVDEELLVEIVNKIRSHYYYIQYNFNSCNANILKGLAIQELFQSRISYTLSLTARYEETVKSYSTNHKRNLKKSLNSDLKVFQSEQFETLIQLFRKFKGEEMSVFKDKHYRTLFSIYKGCKSNNVEKLYVAKNKENKVVAGALFVFFRKRIIYLFGVSSPEGKEKGAMTLIFDHLIKEFSHKDYLLDFEGGEVEGIGRFYRGFGGIAVTYSKLSISRIPFLKA